MSQVFLIENPVQDVDVVLSFTLSHVQIACFMQYCYEQASSILNLFHI